MVKPGIYLPRPEKWPQFSVRGLLIMMTLLGVGLGWLGTQLKWLRERHQAMESIDYSLARDVYQGEQLPRPVEPADTW